MTTKEQRDIEAGVRYMRKVYFGDDDSQSPTKQQRALVAEFGPRLEVLEAEAQQLRARLEMAMPDAAMVERGESADDRHLAARSLEAHRAALAAGFARVKRRAAMWPEGAR